MRVIDKLLKGDKVRISRLHDEKGNLISRKNLISHCLPAFSSGFLRLFFNYRIVQPWISYSAAKIIKRHLNKSSRVLEFGSGMSTIWYSYQAGQVFSVEDYKPWYEKISKIITHRQIENITYKLAENEVDYYQFMHNDEERFDFIIVDGSCRSKCIQYCLNLLRPGGILYLDNSDKDSSTQGGDMRIAERLIRDFSKKNHCVLSEFVDFAPSQFFVQQGLMIKLPG